MRSNIDHETIKDLRAGGGIGLATGLVIALFPLAGIGVAALGGPTAIEADASSSG